MTVTGLHFEGDALITFISYYIQAKTQVSKLFKLCTV